jgi:hypothetical protein
MMILSVSLRDVFVFAIEKFFLNPAFKIEALKGFGFNSMIFL